MLLVAEIDGVPIVALPATWSSITARTKVASDFGLFIEPASRGGMTAPRLLKAYIEWAKEQGAVMIQAGITTGVHVEQTTRLYEKLGFRNNGQLFELEN